MSSALTSKPLTRSGPLWGLFILQLACTLFFLTDAVADVFGMPEIFGERGSDFFEPFIVAALLLSLVFTGLHIRKVLTRQAAVESQLRAASGEFVKLVDEHFEDWALTPSERDVAMLAIKGLSIADMARLRETKEGTIKAQCNAIYRKAGVTGRPQLLSMFIEELLAEGLAERSG